MTSDVFHFLACEFGVHGERENMIGRIFCIWEIPALSIGIRFLKMKRNRIIDAMRNSRFAEMLRHLLTTRQKYDGILMPDRSCASINRWRLNEFGIIFK